MYISTNIMACIFPFIVFSEYLYVNAEMFHFGEDF